MMLRRRDGLKIGVAAGASGLLSGCSQVIRHYTAPALPPSLARPGGDPEPMARLLDRVAFGPAPRDLDRVVSLGKKAYIEEQLRAEGEEDRTLTLRLRGIDALRENAMEMRDLPDYEVLSGLQQAALLRAVYSRYPLRERMVDFWGNHFNIYGRKGWAAFFKPGDEDDVIRAHALGTFPDLLRASARSPAMLAYLDNEVNAKGVPNENYARELMELHALGVHGGYTQKDVQEVARCLTGWTVENRFLRRRGSFRFDPERHDDGAKTVLGVRIPPGGGVKDGERVLDLLAEHPNTAQFIAAKLCRYFLGTEDAAWTERIAGIYRKTGGDIRAMLRPILLSDELIQSPPVIKRPYDFVVSSLRVLGADTDGGKPIQEHLARMGQPLYQWPMPDGYPDATAAWTGSLLARWNFALALTSGGIGGTTVPLEYLARLAGAEKGESDALMELIYCRPADAKLLRPLRRELKSLASRPATDEARPTRRAEVAALCLAAPAFQWR